MSEFPKFCFRRYTLASAWLFTYKYTVKSVVRMACASRPPILLQQWGRRCFRTSLHLSNERTNEQDSTQISNENLSTSSTVSDQSAAKPGVRQESEVSRDMSSIAESSTTPVSRAVKLQNDRLELKRIIASIASG